MILLLNLLTFLLAAAPLLLVLYLMIARHWRGGQAGIAGWLTAVVVAITAFGAGGQLILVALGKALLLALFVLYIIWMALLLYHIVNEAGAIAVIGQELPRLAPDKPAQALLLGWLFGSFLQGASGYGVPAAVVAPLLASLGFAAHTAVLIALIGHGWAVTFGSLGASFFSLIAASEWPGEQLAGPAAALLGLCCLACGLAVLWASGGFTAVRQRWLLLLILSVIMAGTQWGLALAGFWSMAALAAALVGLIVAVIIFRWGEWGVGTGEWGSGKVDLVLLGRAMLPYGLLTAVILLGHSLLKQPLDLVRLNLYFPAVTTRSGWHTPAEPGQVISLLGHPGALLLYAGLLSFAWYRWQGTFRPGQPYLGRTIWRKTVHGAMPTTISIITLLAMSVTMQHAGMTRLLADALSNHTGPFFPLLSPFIGALGAFMSGSNTNSNVIFGLLQQQTATTLDLSVPIILAAQTTGGAIGSLFAPAKVIVGCSTVTGVDEGLVLKSITLYGLAITAVISLLVWLLA